MINLRHALFLERLWGLKPGVCLAFFNLSLYICVLKTGVPRWFYLYFFVKLLTPKGATCNKASLFGNEIVTELLTVSIQNLHRNVFCTLQISIAFNL